MQGLNRGSRGWRGWSRGHFTSSPIRVIRAIRGSNSWIHAQLRGIQSDSCEFVSFRGSTSLISSRSSRCSRILGHIRMCLFLAQIRRNPHFHAI